MDGLHAFWLGIIQGITEFLPISSSAHLILTPVFTGWADQGVAFDLAVHVGTLLAVVLYFHRDVFELSRDGLVSLAQRKMVGQGRLAFFLVVATIPAGLAGLLLMGLIDTELRSVNVIFATTLLFGLLLGWADFSSKKSRTMSDMTWVDALWVGLAQAIAIIPGTSRSGSTMTAGLLLGFNRETASRFSFLLAIPITALATSAKLVEVLLSSSSPDWASFAIGAATSFVTALTAIHFFLKWLGRVGMWPYVIYRIILAAVIYVMFIA